METAIIENFKHNARLEALSTAIKLNPSERAYNAQLNGGNTVKPTSKQIIADAEIIYGWLIEVLNA